MAEYVSRTVVHHQPNRHDIPDQNLKIITKLKLSGTNQKERCRGERCLKGNSLAKIEKLKQRHRQ